MTSRSFSPPIRVPRRDLPLPEVFWLDLPLAWGNAMARSLHGCLAPAGEGPSAPGT